MVRRNVHRLEIEVFGFNFWTHDDCKAATPEEVGNVIERPSQDVDAAQPWRCSREGNVVALFELGLKVGVGQPRLRFVKARLNAGLRLVRAPAKFSSLFLPYLTDARHDFRELAAFAAEC